MRALHALQLEEIRRGEFHARHIGARAHFIQQFRRERKARKRREIVNEEGHLQRVHQIQIVLLNFRAGKFVVKRADGGNGVRPGGFRVAAQFQGVLRGNLANVRNHQLFAVVFLAHGVQNRHALLRREQKRLARAAANVKPIDSLPDQPAHLLFQHGAIHLAALVIWREQRRANPLELFHAASFFPPYRAISSLIFSTISPTRRFSGK